MGPSAGATRLRDTGRNKVATDSQVLSECRCKSGGYVVARQKELGRDGSHRTRANPGKAALDIGGERNGQQTRPGAR